MRVPDAGQPLFERQIVREGRTLAERLMADYPETRDLSLPGLLGIASQMARQALATLRQLSLRA